MPTTAPSAVPSGRILPFRSRSWTKSRMFGSLIGSPGRSYVAGKVGGLAGDRRERRLRRQPVGLPQVVVARHAVVAAALDVDRAEVDDAGEAVRVDDRRAAALGSVVPGFGTWNRTLRSVLSICSSFLYSRSPRLARTGPMPTRCSRSGLPNATDSGITSVIVSPSSSTSIPCRRNASSWAAENVPARKLPRTRRGSCCAPGSRRWRTRSRPGVHVRVVARGTARAARRGRGGTRCR